MSGAHVVSGETGGGADAPAPAGAQPLPSLKKDNCTKPGSQKARFVAEENIKAYIQKFGERQMGVLTVTTPSECLSAFDYQAKWHSWRSHVLVKLFPTGMWTRERQPRSGNWHSHSIVNVGFDIKTDFPFAEVERRFYANVDERTRSLWKQLRERGGDYGFGRIELLPLKGTGAGCARYFTKYLTKAFTATKLDGEEKCRLFGIWGGVRSVSSRFSWVSSRIMRRRKAWLAAQFPEMAIFDNEGFTRMFGQHWWFHFGSLLMDVILPVEYYQVVKDGKLVWDDLGFEAYSADLAKYGGGHGNDDTSVDSQFRLFYAMGERMFGADGGQTLDWAMNRIAIVPKRPLVPLNPQTLLQLEALSLT